MNTTKNKLIQKNNVLECRVCEDVFTVQGERVPRLLYCGHTVCHACLLRLPLKDETILCPFDRQPTPIGESSVWGLKKNFALLELLEKLEQADKESNLSEKQISSAGNEMCHSDGAVYCFACRSQLCSACSHSAHASQCRPDSQVEVEAERLRAMVVAALQTSQQLLEQMNTTVHRLEESVTGMEGGLESAIGRVAAHFEELRGRLAGQESAARASVEAHARERLAALSSTRADLAQRLAQVVSTVVLCESALGCDDARLVSSGAQVRRAVATIQEHCGQFRHLAPVLHFTPEIPITFTKDNRVHIGPKIEMRVVALGLDGAGKTSILFKLKQNEFMSLTPTIGFNVETIEYKNLRFNIWDIGGQPKLRPLWKHYFLNTQAVVFVVDSSDRGRLSEAGVELTKLVAERDLKDAALLILANKQDLERTCGVETLTSELGLGKLCSSHSWHLQPCSAQTGLGLAQGLEWLSGQLVTSPISSP
ncbi:E3 ubiquitin-protein ligase TRIM23 [Halyomorpha halys]|uniref:E3 ubiquitin-protein ligase TRIM23 n=1 Tax=Halyomorpha halys TaxID=286706 RepID=UPI0006D4E673|nr:E3 ubiquitin-protein ligase TRIM23-like isoform X1 [Halyomorpha halys]